MKDHIRKALKELMALAPTAYIHTDVVRNEIEELERVQLQAQADAKAMSDELEYAGIWPLQMPHPSRIMREFIYKFKEFKKTLAELVPIAKELQEDNNTLTAENSRLTRSRDSAWRSFHAINAELMPMREQVAKFEKVTRENAFLRQERDNLQYENAQIRQQYQADLNQRIATIAEMQKQLSALTERILALKIEMH